MLYQEFSLLNKHDFSLLSMKKILSSHFFDFDIENLLGGGTLAKIESNL
jgi:hypothetical protein